MIGCKSALEIIYQFIINLLYEILIFNKEKNLEIVF